MKGGTKLYNRSKLNPEKVTASEGRVLKNVKGRTAPPGTPDAEESPTGTFGADRTLLGSHLNEDSGTTPDDLPSAIETPGQKAIVHKVEQFQGGGGRRRRGGRRRYTRRRKNRRRTRKAGRRRTRKVKRRSRRRRR